MDSYGQSKPRTLNRFWLVLLILPSLVLADNNRVNSDKDDIAIHGYDPVAYFVADKAVPGKQDLSHQWFGATWLFSNAQNRQAFIDNPQQYMPEFGGFCAYAASVGQFADVDPQAWSIVNGRLYLNFSLRVREIWRPRAEEFMGDAKLLWPTMGLPENK